MWHKAFLLKLSCRVGMVIAPLMPLVLLSSCQTKAPRRSTEETAGMPGSDARVLANLESHNGELRREFMELRSSGDWRRRGYFSAGESDRMELLFFRFLTAQRQLGEVAGHYPKPRQDSTLAGEAMATRSHADRMAREQADFLVKTFGSDRIAVAKLNQAYPRSGIPRDTYDLVLESLEPRAKRAATAARVKVDERLNAAAYLTQAEIFLRVSRLRKPGAHLVSFSAGQKERIRSLLQPGDILLTFTAGYASDVFIPGIFKHGITWVGPAGQREAAGLSPDRIVLTGGGAERRKLTRDLRQELTAEGLPANLIEAVAEGVKFSNLDFILDTHINRLLVLRPRLEPGNRARQVSRTFSYLGQDYDFRFDFEDASRQVCTEVIYRSLNGLDGIQFPLTRRGGHATLSADDLVDYWLQQHPGAFELVLYAEEAPGSPGHQARILTGAEGQARVEALMGGKGHDGR